MKRLTALLLTGVMAICAAPTLVMAEEEESISCDLLVWSPSED